MSVSKDYRVWVLDQLGRVVPVSARSMFGGVGLYSDGPFFGLLDDDTLYLKVDDSNRATFERIGSRPFQPDKKKGYTMSYYELPGEIVEDAGQLGKWVSSALECARRAKRKKRK